MPDNTIDIREFAKHMIEETQSTGTSNKAILWVAVGVSFFLTMLCFYIAISSYVTSISSRERIIMLEQKVNNLSLKNIR